MVSDVCLDSCLFELLVELCLIGTPIESRWLSKFICIKGMLSIYPSDVRRDKSCRNISTYVSLTKNITENAIA